MLYNLLTPLAEEHIFFNLFRYLTFRTGGAIMTALIICFIIGPAIIRWLKSKQSNGQPIRALGPETHLQKAGTPTMGGIMILISMVISTLLWADLSNIYVWIVLGVMVGFAAIGFCDDFAKLTKRSHHGISAKMRLFFEVVFLFVSVFFSTDNQAHCFHLVTTSSSAFRPTSQTSRSENSFWVIGSSRPRFFIS